MSRDVSVFDDCNLCNVKIYLNSEFYLYDLNLDFGKKRYAVLFDIYMRVFVKHIMELTASKRYSTFIEKGPFASIDCSRQNESVKSTTVDI